MPHREEELFGSVCGAEDGPHGDIGKTEEVTYHLKSAQAYRPFPARRSQAEKGAIQALYRLGINDWCVPVRIEAAVMLTMSSGLNKKWVIMGRQADRGFRQTMTMGHNGSRIQLKYVGPLAPHDANMC